MNNRAKAKVTVTMKRKKRAKLDAAEYERVHGKLMTYTEDSEDLHYLLRVSSRLAYRLEMTHVGDTLQQLCAAVGRETPTVMRRAAIMATLTEVTRLLARPEIPDLITELTAEDVGCTTLSSEPGEERPHDGGR
jgi:hypothetical protein